MKAAIACAAFACLSLGGILACIVLLFVSLESTTRVQTAFNTAVATVADHVATELIEAQQRVEIVAGLMTVFPRSLVTSAQLARYIDSLKHQPYASNTTLNWAEYVAAPNITAFEASVRAEVSNSNAHSLPTTITQSLSPFLLLPTQGVDDDYYVFELASDGVTKTPTSKTHDVLALKVRALSDASLSPLLFCLKLDRQFV